LIYLKSKRIVQKIKIALNDLLLLWPLNKHHRKHTSFIGSSFIPRFITGITVLFGNVFQKLLLTVEGPDFLTCFLHLKPSWC